MLKQNCVSCGKQFTLTDKEIDFFNNRNLNLPKRCEDCRAKRNEIEIRSEKSFIVKLFEKIVTRESNLTKVQYSFNFSFKNNEELKTHFIKHGRACNCKTPKKYLKNANKIIKSKIKKIWKILKKYKKSNLLIVLLFYQYKRGVIYGKNC